MLELGLTLVGLVLGLWLTRSWTARKKNPKSPEKGSQNDLPQRIAEIKHDYEQRARDEEDKQIEREKELAKNPERIVGGFFRIVEQQRKRRKKDL